MELSKLLHRLGQPLPSWLREELQKVSSIKLCVTLTVFHQLINASQNLSSADSEKKILEALENVV